MNWTYTGIMSLAILSGYVLSRRYQQRLTLDRTQRIGLALGAFCGAMLGAKLPFALADWEGLATGAAWFSDGKTILTGLAGGYLGVEAAKWIFDIRVKTGDTFVVPVAVAIAIGRLACFFGGCCYGTPCTLPWGVDFGDGIRRHPTQIYEFLFHVTAAAVLAQLAARKLFTGQLIKLYILSYLAYRFLTEFIRPEPRLWLTLTLYQWTALALAPIFIALWIHDRRALLNASAA